MRPPTTQSVLDFGLPPPVAARVPLLVEQEQDSTGLLFYRAHSLDVDAPLTFRSISSTTPGATASTLPEPLVEGVIYYARPATPDAFRVAPAPSPAAAILSFTMPAVGRFSYLVDPATALDIAIADACNVVQARCVAAGVSGDTDSPLLTGAARYLAARLYVNVVCAGDPTKRTSYDGLDKFWMETYEVLLSAYFKGVPVPGAVQQPTLQNVPRVTSAHPRFSSQRFL